MEEEARLFFSNLQKGYRNFIVGSDTHELEEELRDTFNEKNRDELERIQILTEKNEHLKRFFFFLFFFFFFSLSNFLSLTSPLYNYYYYYYFLIEKSPL